MNGSNEPPAAHRASDPIRMFIDTRGEAVIRWVIFFIVLAVAIVSLYIYLLHGTVAYVTLTLFLLNILVVLWLLRKKKFQWAFFLFIATLVVVALHRGFTVSGFQTPALLLLPIATMLSGWLLRRSQTWALLAIVTVGLVALAWMQQTGQLPTAPREPAVWALTFGMVCGFGAVLGIAMTSSVREQYARAVQLNQSLVELNRDLDSKVAQRTQDLQDALTRLQSMQEELIHSEKLASLATMVAGIAHELNTPIGNSVTILSTLDDHLQSIGRKVDSGTIKRSQLVNGLQSAAEMARLADRSVNRAATLITSFKQVAIDQVSERRRPFDLREVVEENLETLRPGIKHKPWVLTNAIEPGIACDGYPGPLGQVVTNLVQNAIIHGFGEREYGNVEISAQTENGQLTLTVADDGVGMDAATRNRVFEPFFTTRLGQGGSGLGMAICFRIVNSILAGDIRAVSLAGSGTQVVLRFPQRTPGAM
ncbi:ATP-binding protein [Rhodoferax sp. GW822-FHT02A01]|uniref:ATP-binding protein n=1 Tax=Rhodoferax sp. GW822-FHT02A01 TaxID=3141537 RepID=UPI00315D736A